MQGDSVGKKIKGSQTLFIELASIDEVTSWVPTAKDHDADMVPPWCELVLEVKRTEGQWPLSAQWPLRRHDGELIIEVLHQTLHPNNGQPTADMLWEQLDTVVDRIQARVERGLKPRNTDVGEARGLATAIAIMVNPFGYDVDAVKDEAMERYADRTA
jgi:hypothetical protein